MYNIRFISGKTLAVAASLALLAACGGGDDDGVDISGTTTTTQAGGTTTTTQADGTTTTTSGDTTTTTAAGGTTTTTIIAAAVRLDNFGRGFCVTEDGANRVVAAANCFGDVAADNWRVIGYADDKVAFQNLGTNRCISVSQTDATPPGGEAVTAACDGSAQTLFTRPASTAVTNGVNLRNDASTQCLEISAANNTAGGQITQWTCGLNSAHQTWTTTGTGN